ncbi:MAG TPA: UDP-N-acetylmuramoyl-tripeptide--D-alanyl-D-alanine ligase [Acidimicrobiales bacterium]|nr:UDP-N-acetylmuramoyl-tripeptide--D-alanyl-D-alanine ligase [Acidimicrobiales bacterium]
MEWTPGSVAEATGGKVVAAHGAGRTDVQPTLGGVVIDSRLVSGGELFVAIKAQRDGHGFVGDAVRGGALAVMVDDGKLSEGLTVPAVVVGDTGEALLALGSAARRRLSADVVGITGSVGKTSTKDLASAALSRDRRVTASERSFNNELGVPLTLANAPVSTEVAVIEMGARGPGHIALLCRVAQPTVAVVTAVAAAHTEMFRTLDNVAAAKGELVEALPPGGTAILNADDSRVASMASRTGARALFYSAEGAHADLVAVDTRLDDQLRPTFTARTPWGTARVQLEARGAHQVQNALAALAVAGVCGVDVGEAAAGLAQATLSPWRMELTETSSGALLLNDAYNANPASMKAALESLASLPATRRIAVLGTMAELGERSAKEHLAIARFAGDLGIEVVAVGTADYGRPAAAGIEEVIDFLGDLEGGDAVLVKASRAAGLERLATRLSERSSGPDSS